MDPQHSQKLTGNLIIGPMYSQFLHICGSVFTDSANWRSTQPGIVQYLLMKKIYVKSVQTHVVQRSSVLLSMSTVVTLDQTTLCSPGRLQESCLSNPQDTPQCLLSTVSQSGFFKFTFSPVPFLPLSLKLLPTPIFKFQWLPLLLEESCTPCLPVRLPPAPTASSQGSPSSLSAVRTTVLPSAVICLLQLSPLQGLLFFTSPCSLILLMAQGSFSTSIPQEDIPNLPLIHFQRPVLCQHPSQL